MLHEIFQRHGIPPHEVYNYPHRWKRFIYGSMRLELEEEDKARKRDELRRMHGRRRG